MEIYKYKSYDLYCKCNECVCLNNYCKDHKFKHDLDVNDIVSVNNVIDYLGIEKMTDPLNTYFLVENNKIKYKSDVSNLIYFIMLYSSTNINLPFELIIEILDYL